MKKTIITAFIFTALIMSGCGGGVDISCKNDSSLYLVVSGDANGVVESKETGVFHINSGECLQFTGVSGTITVKNWGYHCFHTDNGFTFENDDIF
ncbi:MAG TPA: hypothetical protein VKS21_06580 [Spirochaetota bacterium]|nr:hypothetical protein [Spirochaetota bacterium]